MQFIPGVKSLALSCTVCDTSIKREVEPNIFMRLCHPQSSLTVIMNCNFEPNSTVIPGVKFGQFVDSFADGINCPPTCLRPDPGGTLVPWLYALFLLFFHLPACIIRALRWESAQYLALGLALFSVALCIQSYLSTGLDAGEVLVWMPLSLMLDIGAMM